MKPYVLFFVWCLFSIASFAQKKNYSYQLHIQPVSSPIKIDGDADDIAWQTAATADNFFMVLPMDTSFAEVKTVVKVAFDKQNLYLLAVCYNGKEEGPYMVESLKRDFSFLKNDNFLLFIDPFDDRTNGFTFGANAAGAQWDGTMYEGGKVDLSWDNKWYSVVKNYDDKWILEAAIPFKTIRFKKGIREWGINFSRNDLKSKEKSSWAPVPRQFPTASLAYTGTLVWDEPPPEPGPNISLIPYALVGVSKDYEKRTPATFHHEIGGDAKIGITSSLNLDLTVNPDFSQVDVDQQVTNLSRFELFYPEKRQFFLENGDQFSNFGYPTIRPFFSRRIGLDAPIRAGARLSGKIDKNWRIGGMDMQTGAVDSAGLPSQNFAVIALQRKIFSRSNIGFIFINKQSGDPPSGSTSQPSDTTKTTYNKYNRNIGMEFNLASSNNIVPGKLLLLKSFTPGVKGQDWTQAGNILYASKKWNLFFQYEYVGASYNAEVGYVPRKDYLKLNPQMTRNFFPKGGIVLSHGPQITSTYYFNTALHRTDNESVLAYLVTFRDRSTITASVLHDYVELLAPFDPTNSGKDSLATGTRHWWNTAGLDILSKPQSLFTYALSFRYGGYYANGEKLVLSGTLGYRFQPYVSILMNLSYSNLNMPQPWGKTSFWLVGPRIDLTLTNKLFLTTFLQYNQQSQNMNINARLQWRYKPASDIFLVYTDNYLPAPFAVRNREIVLKFNYWWNL
ncbi:MAG: hydrolase [Bacteroidetes bacterium]|nr:MAG: hydrolase [Bacteroidota bacterium]